MATEAQKRELTDKVNRLIKDRFGGDWHKAFEHYDSDKQDGRISKAELGLLLQDAGIGNWLTRGAWADGIIAALDANQDSAISGPEFEAVLKGTNQPPPTDPDQGPFNQEPVVPEPEPGNSPRREPGSTKTVPDPELPPSRPEGIVSDPDFRRPEGEGGRDKRKE
jgi:hypothetical protein